MINVLFICQRNTSISRTAEVLLNGLEGYKAISSGVDPSSRRSLRSKMITWADIIFVAEQHHADVILKKYPIETLNRKIIVMDIKGDFNRSEPLIRDMIILSTASELQALKSQMVNR